MNRLLKVFLAGIVFAGFANMGHADIYRWVDENGKVHFSDKAPPDQAAEDISGTAQRVNVDEGSKEQEKLRKVFAPVTPEEKALQQQQQAATEQERLALKKQCEDAKRLLKTITEKRFYIVEEDGTERDVSKAEAQQKRQELESFIQINC